MNKHALICAAVLAGCTGLSDTPQYCHPDQTIVVAAWENLGHPACPDEPYHVPLTDDEVKEQCNGTFACYHAGTVYIDHRHPNKRLMLEALTADWLADCTGATPNYGELRKEAARIRANTDTNAAFSECLEGK